ncbi:hypothetical protein ACSU1N_06730 [Thermogladius sp. 4427co]|uniref:hypothetical protein n=1 Tax=Thermogladius sp. 4427co TaxID=3450718 RepID=UPI003F7B134D
MDFEDLGRYIASSVDASVRVEGDRLFFDVAVELPEPVGGRICLWLNPGLDLGGVEAGSRFQLSHTLSKFIIDVADVHRFELGLYQPIKSLRLSYQGLLKPLFAPTWGSHGDTHVARGEILWYPFPVSCRDLLPSIYLCEHKKSAIRFRLRDGLVPAASLEYRGVEEGEYVYANKSKTTSMLEFVIAPFKTDFYEAEKRVYVYSLGEPPYRAREIHDIILEVESVFEELFGVSLPRAEYSIVFLSRTGGFKADHLIVLDREQAETQAMLKSILIHELSHTWWLGFIKPCSSDTAWIMEAVPEYMTTLAKSRLGLSKLDEMVDKTIGRAGEIVMREGYKPPTSILIPLNETEDRSWRVVGEAILHEIARIIGCGELNQILGHYMKESESATGRYCVKWGKIIDELASVNERILDVVGKYTGTAQGKQGRTG